eukprot:gene15982-19007_t
MLPPTLQVLKIGEDFDQLIGHGVLPNTLKHLTIDGLRQPSYPGAYPIDIFEREVLQPIQPGALPASLTHLIIGYDIIYPFPDNTLPMTLEHLEFQADYDHRLLPGLLPTSLRYLDLGWAFDRPITPGILPKSLQHLDLGSKFNQPLLPNALPTTLKYLGIGERFNQPIGNNTLPASLTTLSLCHDGYSQLFDLPPLLEKIVLNKNDYLIGAQQPMARITDHLCRYVNHNIDVEVLITNQKEETFSTLIRKIDNDHVITLSTPGMIVKFTTITLLPTLFLASLKYK